MCIYLDILKNTGNDTSNGNPNSNEIDKVTYIITYITGTVPAGQASGFTYTLVSPRTQVISPLPSFLFSSLSFFFP